MRENFRWLGAVALAFAVTSALARPETATAQVALKQIELTARHIGGFIAVQRKMATAKNGSELEAIAKAHGFSSLDEHDDVEANILMLMDSIDPQSRAFTEPPVTLERRIAEVKADKSIPDAERSQVLQELAETRKIAQPIRFPANIELVKKYYDQLQAALQ
jgi:hypothetical protein